MQRLACHHIPGRKLHHCSAGLPHYSFTNTYCVLNVTFLYLHLDLVHILLACLHLLSDSTQPVSSFFLPLEHRHSASYSLWWPRCSLVLLCLPPEARALELLLSLFIYKTLWFLFENADCFQRSSDTRRLDYHWPVLGYSGRKLVSRGSLSILSSICSPKHSFPSCT